MGREARANQTTDEIGPFHFSVPFAKVDKEKRLVSGVATAENIDKQGEIVDYETAKKFFTDTELWPGNIREMHKGEAVGTAVDVECDDANKVISITARVSKGAPNTWEKVVDGTLKMFSIGGSGKRVVEKVGDTTRTVKRLFLEQLAEVSLVDNGANPLAKFDIVKSVDGALVTMADEVVEPFEKAEAAVDAALAAAQPVAAVVVDPPIASVYVVGSIRKLIAALAISKARVVEKTAIIEQATAAGAEAVLELPYAWQPEAVRKGGPEPYDIDQALSAISVLEHLLQQEYWDAKYGSGPTAAPDPVKVAQCAAIKSAIDAVLQFVVSEHQEQFSADANGDGGLDIEVISDDALVEMFVKSLDVVRKAGARHSKKDQEMVQKVHDTSEALGASCHMDEAADKVLKFVARPAVVEILKNAGFQTPAAAAIVVEPSETVQKIAAELETAKAALIESQAAVAKQAETAAALEARLKTLEDAPAGGGPLRNASVVDKALGSPSGDESASADSVVKALQAVADGTKDPAAKSAIAMEIVKISHRNQIALSTR